MPIKSILDEIKNVSGSNAKMEILSKYKDNELLHEAIVLANSSRVKFYIRQIPEYTHTGLNMPLKWAFENLADLSNREVTGTDASNHLCGILSDVSENDAFVIKRIIDKDLKIGMGSTNINKIIPNLIERTPYMGAKPFSEKLVNKLFEREQQAISQIKMDGRYCNAIIDGGHVHLLSRSGEQTYVGNAKFMTELEQMPNCVLNGELTVDGFDRLTANGYVASVVDIEGKRDIREEEETAHKIEQFGERNGIAYSEILKRIRLTVWDRITLTEYHDKKSTVEYFNRLNYLTYLVAEARMEMVSIIETRIVSTYEEAMEHFLEALERELEGTIVKAYEGTWKDGKPNWQVKMKLEMNIDLKIIGFKYGTEGSKNENVIATLLCESSCGLLKANPAGMTDAMMQYITENQESLLGAIVELKCCGLSQNKLGDWSVFHPSFIEIRTDKDICDSLESAKEVEAMAKTLDKKTV